MPPCPCLLALDFLAVFGGAGPMSLVHFGRVMVQFGLFEGMDMLTEAEILSEVIEPDRGTISAGAAREILSLRYHPETSSRIRILLASNNAGTITAEERVDLEKYRRVGQLIDLLQAKARLSLASARDHAP
jgi:hypothetical protein